MSTIYQNAGLIGLHNINSIIDFNTMQYNYQSITQPVNNNLYYIVLDYKHKTTNNKKALLKLECDICMENAFNYDYKYRLCGLNKQKTINKRIDMVKLICNCNHNICKPCAKTWLSLNKTCPFCSYKFQYN